LASSTFSSIVPGLPTIQILSPANGGTYKDDLNVTAVILGEKIAAVTFRLNGQIIKTSPSNGTLSFSWPSQNYPDGTHLLEVVAMQTTGLTTSQNQSFSLNNALNNLAQSMNILSTSQTTWSNQQGALANSLNALNSKQTQAQNQIQNLTDTLHEIGETQQNATEQMGTLNSSLKSTVQEMNSQIMELQNDLQTAEQLATAGILIGVLDVIVAIAVAMRRRSKTLPSPLPLS